VSLARPWVIARMKALGLAVDFWTVDDPELARRLVALGADGIMTNDPRRIVPALRPPS
jgi:glycerophosphoryl diester phosphodiesterase